MTPGDWPQGEGEDAFLLHVPEWSYRGKWPEHIGVAVSGGSDSLALLHLFARIQAHRGGTVHAVTVDHRLRAEAAEEARFVARFCDRLGVSHDTLVWEHGEIAGNVPDQARRARYALVGDWARGKGIGDVVLGHTADDRAETFLMELAREAGIDGLTAMRVSWQAEGIRWSRPLISVARAELRAYLTRHGIGWIDDPTNEDLRFQRVKARRALAALAPLGITAQGLSHVVGNLSVARSDLVELAFRTAQQIARADAGEVIFDLGKWQRAGNDTRRRLLIAALRWVASEGYAPRAAQIARLEQAIRQGRDATLWGCRMRVGQAEIRISREPRAVAAAEGRTDEIWDGRWRISGPHDRNLRIRALGTEGLHRCPDWRETGHSRAALIVSPAIWRGETLISAPLAGFMNGWMAEIVAAFPSCILSH